MHVWFFKLFVFTISDLFPHLLYTKRFLDWRFSQIKGEPDDETEETSTGQQPQAPPVLPAVLRRLRRRKPLGRGSRRNLASSVDGPAWPKRRDGITTGSNQRKSRGTAATRKQLTKTRCSS